jgi:hypothetical protein
MPAGWQQGLVPKPNNLKGLLVEDMVPAFLRQTYLLGINLGAAWDGAPGDAAMQQLINVAVNDLQSKLGIRFATQRVLTDPDPGKVLGTDYDILGERLHYFAPQSGESSHYIPLPYAHVTSIQRVRMLFGEQLLYTIPNDWIRFTSKEGILRLVATLTSGMFQTQFSTAYPFYRTYLADDAVPDVWSVDYTFGHGRIDYDLAHYIGLVVAVQVLGIAGMGTDISGGVASESLSMDGISESVNYIQGKYGPYSGLITAYKEELERVNLDKKRAEKKGFKLGIL